MSTPKGKLKVCRIEYETKDKTNWKAVIIAYNMDDAVKYLRNNVKDFDRYISTNLMGDIDAIETKAYNDYFISKTEVVETVIQNEDVNEVPNEAEPQCPWCDKTFKSKNTLSNHIKKYHME